jgi:glycosyltransferase involved in cell wall biosynthesis
MKKHKKIIFSIVLCTYNREKHIEQCLKSLVNQNFPRDQYEIIVVDDGSTDSTRELVAKFPVKIITHKINKGIAAARNTGLKNAKGDIFICFDDDCYADKNWLKNLAYTYKKYDLNDISGIAGIIKLLNKPSGIIEKYMDKIGYANPSPLTYVRSKSLFMRFYSYIKNMFAPNLQIHRRPFEVGEIWGANCSFPIAVLKSVNGWDENLSGVEDTDLCDRINKKFNDRKFICTKNAIIFHDHRLSYKNFLKKPYSRGPATLNFYIKNKKIPPIFPFPIAILLLSLLFLIINPLSLLLSLLFLPQLFYCWWIIKAIQKREGGYLTFPYLQSTYELSSVLGLIKGYVK